ncbi:MobF family relaxase [Eilatimonas milleporae]|uniref:Conjugative relaxase-like TrwC/TraI family protein n=1 Tax=Eilatimonas milleporae TaxID=911205 RepID=A0A3M0CHC8_9PROT|nr:MobF family relaxase [Eilatimonas milleporae]RMB09044.1 conjugative relaxase-like TrwC/TraI family protein [Eilatimonas milleporae]
MLSIGKIDASPGVAARYYKQGDYYTKSTQEVSAWAGKGSQLLGLNGPVKARDLEKVLSGILPKGHTAGWANNHKGHAKGWDLTFSAPKGVSVMATVGTDNRLVQAHRESVKEALSWMETYAYVRVRSEDKSIVFKQTGNLVAGMFTEFFSRALDPQLHTHCPVANMTYDTERTGWYALHSDALYKMKMAAGQIYRNALAFRARELGYAITANARTGLFDITGVPESLLDIYSQRRKEIKEHADKEGWKSAEDLARATLLTRPNKKHADHESIMGDLRLRAKDNLLSLAKLKLHAEQREAPVQRDTKHARRAVKLGLSHLSSREAVFEHGHAVQESLKTNIGQVTLEDIEAELPEQSGRYRYQSTQQQTGGKRIYQGHTLENSVVWETRLWKLLERGRRVVRPLANEKRTHTALAVSSLTQEQKGAARYVLRSRNRFLSIEGVAGAGKSHLIRTLVEAVPSRIFYALAPTASAALDLGESAGIQGGTLAGFLQKGGRDTNHKTILVVDEASMSSTRQAVRLMQIAEKKFARILFTGQRKQFDSIEQGKPYSLMLDAGLEGPYLKKSYRQKNGAMKYLVAAAKDGKVSSVFNLLGDRVEEIDNECLAKEVADKWIGHAKRDHIQIASLDNKGRIAINGYIRDHLQSDGIISSRDHQFHVLSSKALTPAQLTLADYYDKGDRVVFHMGHNSMDVEKDEQYEVLQVKSGMVHLKPRKSGKPLIFDPLTSTTKGMSLYRYLSRELSVGDKIQWRQNLSNGHNIQNGHTGKVVAINGDKATITFDHGVQSTIDLKEHPYWDHGYAITTYKQQGKTTPINWIVANTQNSPEINQKTLYVSVSRAQYSVQIFTDNVKRFRSTIEKNPGGKTSSLEGLGVDIKLPEAEDRRIPETRHLEKIFDRFPENIRTSAMNVLDIFEQRRRTHEQHADRHPTISKATKSLGKDLKTSAAEQTRSRENEAGHDARTAEPSHSRAYEGIER